MELSDVPPENAEDAIRRIAEATRGTPYEGRLYVVGGYLRDRRIGRANTQPLDDLSSEEDPSLRSAFLERLSDSPDMPSRRPLEKWESREAKEVDMALEGDALDLAGFLYQRRVSSGPPVTYPRFGTAMLRVNNIMVELVTARRESYEASSRKPTVEPATIAEDAMRRDFTINTLFRNVHTGVELDPTGQALEDLARGVIRTPLDPDQTFFDDPLRMMRAARFAAQLGFQLDPLAAQSIRRNRGRLDVISRERIRDEWTKLLLSSRPALGVALLQDLGLLSHFLPELAGIATSPLLAINHRDWNHTLDLLRALSAGPLETDPPGTGARPPGDPSLRESLSVRLAAALHHAVGSRVAGALLFGLRYSTVEARHTALLLEAREKIISVHPDQWTDGAVRRWIRLCTTNPGGAARHLDEFFTLCWLDRASGDSDLASVDLEDLWQRVNRLENEVPSASLESPLDGAAIMALLGIHPGPRVREVKDWLLDKVLEGELAPEDSLAAKRLVLDPQAGWRTLDRTTDQQKID